MKAKFTCNSCNKVDPVTDKPGTGMCRALPPSVQLVMAPKSPLEPTKMMLTAQRFFPPVDMNNDWCAQHPEFSTRLTLK